ncbi:MAG: dihydroorotase, partial [Gammaproteobacteria bacterium]
MSWGETYSIVGGRLIDPAGDVDDQLDLHIAEGRVLALGKPPPGFEPEVIIDAAGRVVCPGLIDLATSLREPGMEQKATIASESAAA